MFVAEVVHFTANPRWREHFRFLARPFRLLIRLFINARLKPFGIYRGDTRRRNTALRQKLVAQMNVAVRCKDNVFPGRVVFEQYRQNVFNWINSYINQLSQTVRSLLLLYCSKKKKALQGGEGLSVFFS
ncbi:MAG: hypothetical protein IKS45_11905 [Thermoguttaceae bacterium]|nr:hypothetical protein [Thermoguttaceae bacterium]